MTDGPKGDAQDSLPALGPTQSGGTSIRVCAAASDAAINCELMFHGESHGWEARVACGHVIGMALLRVEYQGETCQELIRQVLPNWLIGPASSHAPGLFQISITGLRRGGDRCGRTLAKL